MKINYNNYNKLIKIMTMALTAVRMVKNNCIIRQHHRQIMSPSSNFAAVGYC